MTNILAAGRDLYAALASGDVVALKRLLSADFQGQLSPGLPHDLGRAYVGLDSMMEAWGIVDALFDMSPQPEELIDAGGVLIGRGDYVGAAKATGKPVRAAFVHFWSFDGDRFTAVRQVTDSGKWRDALDND